MRRVASAAAAALDLGASSASRPWCRLGAGLRGSPQTCGRAHGSRRGAASFGSVEISEARLHQLLEAEITAIAMKETQPMTLQSIIKMGSDVEGLAKLLHEELPVRFAQRILMLESLPDWHRRNVITEVRQMYVRSFKELRMANPEDAAGFPVQIFNIKKRHAHTNLLVGGFKDYAQSGEMSEAQINEWLDKFFKLRISTNMLMSQYLNFAQDDLNSVRGMRADYSGDVNPYQSSINEQCPPHVIAQLAGGIVERMCANQYGVSPEIQIIDVGAQPFPFVPRYLFYIVSELLKNSVRATCETHEGAEHLPPVKVIVSGDENVACMRISDLGGGIPVKDLNHVWSYLYTTAPIVDKPATRASIDNPTDVRLLDAMKFGRIGSVSSTNDPDENLLARSPLAGLGCGLPLSRLYATYLGGKIELQTLPKYGTDVFVYLNRLGQESENLDESTVGGSLNSMQRQSPSIANTGGTYQL